jgi:hypothetical protein
MPLQEATAELANNYKNKAIMSWDGLVRPIQIYAPGSPASNLPPYLVGPDTSDVFGEETCGFIFDGATANYNKAGNGANLCPTVPPGTLLDNRVGRQFGDMDTGHDFEILARSRGGEDGSVDSPPASSLVLPIQGYNQDTMTDYETYDYRLLALRGPLILQGWGYDVNGKPIPNRADSEAGASGGNFVSTGLQDKFIDNFLRKPHTWPCGAVDLRWDRQRK